MSKLYFVDEIIRVNSFVARQKKEKCITKNIMQDTTNVSTSFPLKQKNILLFKMNTQKRKFGSFHLVVI